ncbi:MAG: RNA degradosome polyphosphate kinase [Peptococcaceae bacterium]
MEKSDYFINRELSWLEFNHRVLQEAKDKTNPLWERLKFLAIVASNLDEFFMVRVASLKDLVNAGFNKPDPAGLPPKQQLKQISVRAQKMVADKYNLFNRILKNQLEENNFFILQPGNLNQVQKDFLQEYFTSIIYPVLTPLAVDHNRPFPLILNKSLNIGVFLRNKDLAKDYIFATVQVPVVLPRLISLPAHRDGIKEFIFLEDVIMLFMARLFSGNEIICSYPYRIIRNADLTIEENEDEDFLLEIEKSLKKRKWGQAVKLEVNHQMDEKMVELLRKALEIHHRDVYYAGGPLDLTFLMKIYAMEGYEDLKYPTHFPQPAEDLLNEENIFEALGKKDILIHLPYESFDPVIDFIKKAAEDPKVLAIKQTLYRVSGNSPIIEALVTAAEQGKQVTVLLEVKARFDEENNIHWAKRLEQAGCHVIYGLVGLKTHAKISLVVRLEEDGIKRYVHLGTGNYNDITAKFYTDLGLFTSNEYFGADASALFNMLSGYSQVPEMYKLTIAPTHLKIKILELIKTEEQNAHAGKKAKIMMKLNSLVDTDVIEALYHASTKGVKIDLIIRGICCLRPGLPGISENITVRSIVGRFLEHPRIYYFYHTGNEQVFLSSADLMPRNLNRRVEILFPVEDPLRKRRVINILIYSLLDTVKSRNLLPDGKYKPVDKRGKALLNSQEYFTEQALQTNNKYNGKAATLTFIPIIKDDIAK